MGTKCNSYCGKFSENIMACFVFVWRSSFKSFGNDKVSLFLIRCLKEQSFPSSKIKVKVLIFYIISKKAKQKWKCWYFKWSAKKKDKTEVKVMTFCIIRTTKVKNISSTFIFFLPFWKDLTDESHQLRSKLFANFFTDVSSSSVHWCLSLAFPTMFVV